MTIDQISIDRPDLTHIDTWLFDLDNTLYPPEVGYLKLVEAKILAYFMRLTGLPSDQAWALQKKYLNEYGTAVPGLVQHHGVDPHDFMADVHDVPTDSLTPDPALRRGIARLPGRKLVFTNGSAWHAERVLKKLNLADLFAEVFHAEASNLIPKPDQRAFDALIAAHAVTPRTTAFFEDRAVNLKPAAALGMTTILVGPEAQEGAATSTDAFVEHRTATLAPFLDAARVKEPVT